MDAIAALVRGHPVNPGEPGIVELAGLFSPLGTAVDLLGS